MLNTEKGFLLDGCNLHCFGWRFFQKPICFGALLFYEWGDAHWIQAVNPRIIAANM